MDVRTVVTVSGAAMILCGCVAHTRPEDAAMVMSRPAGPALGGNLPAKADYPSIGGDILSGYTPADLAAARAAATRVPASSKTPPPPGG